MTAPPECDGASLPPQVSRHRALVAGVTVTIRELKLNLSTENLQVLAEALGGDFLPAGWERVASKARSRVARQSELGLVFKHYMKRSPATTVTDRLRGNRLQHAQEAGETLRYFGFDTPDYITDGQLPDGSTYTFMRAAEGQSLQQWLLQGAPQTRRLLLPATGRYVGRLHATGFVHGAMRPDDLFIAEDKGTFRFTLINNEEMRRELPPSGRNLLRNLRSLNFDALRLADRRRFFGAWCEQMRDLSSEETAVLAKAVLSPNAG